MSASQASVPAILVIGTADTKADELLFMRQSIVEAGGRVQMMDVGILGEAPFDPDLSKHEVARAAGTTIEAIAALGDENAAMTEMARGAAALALEQHASGRVQGMIALGGTMGTDLALDVASALPIGVPKFVVSTVAFSHLIPPDRIAPDLMMILWAGGLYGLNDICRSALSQAAGAVLGAARARVAGSDTRPVIGMTSLGKSCLQYMVALKPALEQRGFELAVFHTTGMGGRAFESLARQGFFAAVMDFSLQELANDLNGSVVTAGADRLEGAGAAGVPQIVAPGAVDLIDMPTWQGVPQRHAGRGYHAHNRLIASVNMTSHERRLAARAIADKLAAARGPTRFILPLRGIEEWDRPGEALHDPEGLDAFIDEVRKTLRPPAQLVELDAHINDPAFVELVLASFDEWVREGVIRGAGS
ncbi:MAG: Tm-1-like ATP-binding domain-containing protein [Burkholderiales bacterium]|nr:MAG: Tm-1-like ATP-binding domain-containing protein [Burkholderiales bacterium]